MIWVKYLIDKKSHKAGELVQMDEAAANVLIENEIVEKSAAPPTDPADNDQSALQTIAKATAAEMLKELRKGGAAPYAPMATDDSLSPAGKPWATARKYSSLKSFTKTRNGRSPEQQAYEWGMWCLGAYGHNGAREYCKAHGLGYTEDSSGGDARMKTARENNNASAAFLVPDLLEADIIDLREQYGTFRKYAKVKPMTSDTVSYPRRTGGLTVYVVGESASPTSSDKNWDRVRMTAKKIGVLTKYTKDLSEDAVLGVGDDLADEISYAITKFEDQCGWLGDGTSTYASITGVGNAIDGVGSNKGIQTGSGTGWSGVTLADHNNMLGLLPLYAFKNGGVAWYCSQSYWGAVMQRLATAAGGNKVADIVDGVPQPQFLGYPVRICQILPVTSASSQYAVFFGNLSMAAIFGDRRQLAVRMSDIALNSFEQDEVAMVGFERFDINVHDYGTSTVAGPIVGLKTS